MATLDDSPSLFAGQQWTDWADAQLPGNEEDEEQSDEDVNTIVAESMKLRIEDMPLFGVCPSRDEFYLVVCEKCQQVLKPQAFQSHLDLRHGGVGSYTVSTKEHSSQSRHSSSKTHSKSHTPSKHHSRSSHPKSQSYSTKIKLLKEAVPKEKTLIQAKGCSGDDVNPSVNSSESLESYVPGKESVLEPPHSFVAVTKVGAVTLTDLVKDSKISFNHSLPVVKVKRIPEGLAAKKHGESYGSARTSFTSLTNGAVKAGKSPSVYTPGETVPDGLLGIKPTKSPTPEPHESPGVPELIESELLPNSEIDSAVNAILEPLSPPEEHSVSSFVTLATSPCTLTTTTVTMATMTSSLTTNVTNTTSTFTFSNMGRPHFPTGSIQVSFSSAGVLSTVSSDSSDSNLNNNNVENEEKVVVKSEPESTIKSSSMCGSGSSNGNMESTINDIVKSTINANRTGGFQSLNPLVLGIPKSSSSLPNSACSSSLKSPTSQTAINKLLGSTTPNSKVGSKLTSGCSSTNKLGSSPPALTPTTPGSSHSVNSDAMKRLQMMNKPDKIIPLKDREYDANKHCGVVVTETGKACTRSLTCKSHALSLRRAVQGRRLPFDELLKEHREAKEAYMKARVESKEAAAALKAASTPHKTGPSSSPGGKTPPYSSQQSSPVLKSLSDINFKDNKSHSIAGFSSSTKLSQHFNRSSITNVQVPSTSVPEEVLSPLNKLDDRLVIDEGEDALGKNNSYTNYHPRPIAACSFGARRHSYYGSSGFGCHSFNRKTDHLQAAFLDLLEKHLNPPPPKKLCVESNLPKENQLLNGTTDPYDFEMLDPTKTSLSQQFLQSGARIIQTPISKVTSKVKSKSNTIIGNKPKLKDLPIVTKPLTIVNSVQTAGLIQKPPGNLKRRSSGCMTPQSAVNTHTSLTGATVVSAPNIIGSVGSLSNSSRPGSQFAIAIPNVNISAATLNQISASLMSSGNLKQNKNNVIKDMGFVVTNIPQEALLNGQYVNIANAQLGDSLTSNQFHQVTLDDRSKPTIQSTQLNKTTGQQKISINNNDAIRAVQIGKGNLITSLTPNAFLVDNSLQTRAILQPVSLSTSTGGPVVSVSGSMFTQQQQQRPMTAPSPQVLSGSDGPHVSASQLPNGVVTASSDKDVVLSHHLPVFQSKTHRGTLQQTSHLIAGTQIPNHVTFQTAMATTTTNQNSGNASQLLTNQLSKIQMKNSNIQKSGSVNKLTVQPVSLTFPFMSGSGGFDLGALGGQAQGHTLLITSEDAKKQGIQLHQMDTTSNSPSNNVIL